MAAALIEMVNLMYQNKTALNYLEGLISALSKELMRRKKHA